MMDIEEIVKRCKCLGISGCHTLTLIDFLVAAGSIYDVAHISKILSDNLMRKVVLERKSLIESIGMIKIAPIGGIKTQKTYSRDYKQEVLRTKFHSRNFKR